MQRSKGVYALLMDDQTKIGSRLQKLISVLTFLNQLIFIIFSVAWCEKMELAKVIITVLLIKRLYLVEQTGL